MTPPLCVIAVLLGVLAASPADMNPIAESYVKLVLELGQHDPDYVDAYYGPPEWKPAADAKRRPLADIGASAAELRRTLEGVPVPADDAVAALRHRYLEKQLGALASRVAMLSGTKLKFDDESRALYDAVAPTFPEEHFQSVRDQLAALLPGGASLRERYDAFHDRFMIPPDKVDAVFQAAITAARERTRKHIALPDGESFRVEYVKQKPWSAYNWYQGRFHSVIQVNTELPIAIDRAIDLACHEGYPGHHVYQVLLEQQLVNGRGWIEFSVYPLFSPQSLISEGSANFGIEMAFPGDERIDFERRVLFPLAGLDPSSVESYERVQSLIDQLSYAQNEAARRYLNGAIDGAAAVKWLEEYALMPHARAAQRLTFIDRYRSYVINYNLGKDLVRGHVLHELGQDPSGEHRWQVFTTLLSTPRVPSSLSR